MDAIVLAATLYLLLLLVLIAFAYKKAAKGRPLVAVILALLCLPSIAAAPALLSQEGVWSDRTTLLGATDERPCGSVRDPRPIRGDECDDFFRDQKVKFAIDLGVSGGLGIAFAAIAVFGISRRRLRRAALATAPQSMEPTEEANRLQQHRLHRLDLVQRGEMTMEHVDRMFKRGELSQAEYDSLAQASRRADSQERTSMAAYEHEMTDAEQPDALVPQSAREQNQSISDHPPSERSADRSSTNVDWDTQLAGLERLSALLDSKHITQSEFDRLKEALLRIE